MQMDLGNGGAHQNHCLFRSLGHILVNPGAMFPDVGNLHHVGAIFEALSEKNINISLISSSELRFSVVVNKDVADDAVKAIHKRFINI